MKLYHISDLHLGRELSSYNILEDQKYALDGILETLKENGAKYLLISGDIYDKYNPSNEACSLFEDFIKNLIELKIRTIIISGNHDSKERLSYFTNFIKKDSIYVSTKIESLSFDDDKISFFLIPYIHDLELLSIYKDDKDLGVSGIYSKLIGEYNKSLKDGYKSICLCHNLIIGGLKSRSEREISVGGIENISKDLFKSFDYTALGHLHKIQKISDSIYYSGSLLKYSQSEFSNDNSMLVYDTDAKDVSKIAIKELRKCKEITCSFEEALKMGNEIDYTNTFVAINLTDSDYIHDAYNRLNTLYPLIISLQYVNIKVGNSSFENQSDFLVDKIDPMDAFIEFYKNVSGKDSMDEQRKIISEVLEEIRKEEAKDEN